MTRTINLIKINKKWSEDSAPEIESQCKDYRVHFIAHVDGVMTKDIPESVNKGLALGSERFKGEMEANLKRRVRSAKMGRNRKVYSDPGYLCWNRYNGTIISVGWTLP